jgi:hypothetical protein
MECLISDYFIEFCNRRTGSSFSIKNIIENETIILDRIGDYELGCYFSHSEKSYDKEISDINGNILLIDNDGSVSFEYSVEFEKIFNFTIDYIVSKFKF